MGRKALSLGRVLLNLFYRGKIKGFCAFCKSPRAYSLKKHLYLHEGLFILGASFVFGAALWEPFDPRAIIIFAVLLGSAEIFMFLKWRMRMVCRHCGFDPVLYNVSPSRAREKVRGFYEEKVRSPGFLLSKSPLLEVHRAHLEHQRLKSKLQRVKRSEEANAPVPMRGDHLPPASS